MVPSAAKENDQLSHKFEAHVVDTVVRTPRTNVPAAGDRLRVHHQKFEELSHEIQIAQAFESAGSMRSHSLKQQQVYSLVQAPERNEEAVGNRFCVCLQKFEELEKEAQFTKACEPAGFLKSLCCDAIQRHSRCE